IDTNIVIHHLNNQVLNRLRTDESYIFYVCRTTFNELVNQGRCFNLYDEGINILKTPGLSYDRKRMIYEDYYKNVLENRIPTKNGELYGDYNLYYEQHKSSCHSDNNDFYIYLECALGTKYIYHDSNNNEELNFLFITDDRHLVNVLLETKSRKGRYVLHSFISDLDIDRLNIKHISQL
ncbi:unnamed protein product, partial [Didymodactylos carnosus]